MVRNLYLLRHGQAVNDLYMSDFDRPLTPLGVNQLAQLGVAIKAIGFYPHKIYCSKARRTQQTAEIIAEQIGYSLPICFLDEIYEASVRTLFGLLTHTDNKHDSVLLIGHNPGISYLVDYLTNDGFGDMHPGKMVKIVFQDLGWDEISKGMGSLQPI